MPMFFKIRPDNYSKILIGILFSFFVLQAYAIDHDAEVLNYETDISIDGGKLKKNVSIKIKINNREGERYCKVRLFHSPMYKTSKIKAFIANNAGSVEKKLSASDIVTKSAISSISFYEDNFVKEFTIKHNVYPYYLNYSYQVIEREFIAIDYWTPVFKFKIPTHKASLQITAPLDYELNYLEKNIEEGVVEEQEKTITYKWEAACNEIYDNENFSPPYEEYMPFVIVVPQKFKYEIGGELTSWQTLGNWQYNINSKLGELPQPEKDQIDNLINGLSDELSKVKALYYYLQDKTRYINISIETGGLKPYPASYVSENKYGDCKALSNYFIAMLSYIGVDAFYTKINAGDEIDYFNHDFPSPQFNHIITCVPINNDTLWIDCTSEKAFSYVGTFIQNREVLVIDADKSFITKTPALTINDVIEQRNIKVTYNNDNMAKIDCRNSYRGDSYEMLFSLNTNYSENRQEQILRNYIVNDNEELQNYSINKSHRDSTFIKLDYTAIAGNYFKAYGNDLLFNVLPFDIPDFESVKDRKLPVQISYPINVVDTIEFSIPEGFVLQRLPADFSEKTEFGSYSFETKTSENKIYIYKHFVLNNGKYTLKQYPELYKFVEHAKSSEEKSTIVLSK